MVDTVMSLALLATWVAPVVVLALLGSVLWLRGPLAERMVSGLSLAASSVQVLAAAAVGVMALRGPVVLEAADWFSVPGYRFPLGWRADGVSAPLLVTFALLGWTGIYFTRTYLHRDEGFARFHVLSLLLRAGMALVLTAGTLDLLFAGWECVGISSALLIGFFRRRATPVENGLYAFATYRVCDVGLLAAAVLVHHATTNPSIHDFHEVPAAWAPAIALCLLLAASGKSALWPVSSWLPRAMEGPTPSSAVFYGAISIHLGIYLLMRAEPLLAGAPWARVLVVTLGMLTALHGWTARRALSDAKGRLAMATLTQVGILVVEVGAGFITLAVAHVCAHALLRTSQFLRAPNLLHDAHLVHAAEGHHAHVPLAAGAWSRFVAAYGLAGGFLEGGMERFVIGPVVRVARALDGVETAAADALAPRSAPGAQTAAVTPAREGAAP